MFSSPAYRYAAVGTAATVSHVVDAAAIVVVACRQAPATPLRQRREGVRVRGDPECCHVQCGARLREGTMENCQAGRWELPRRRKQNGRMNEE